MRIGLDIAQHHLDWPEQLRRVWLTEDAGFGYLLAGWPSEGEGRLVEFAETLLPELTAA